MSALMTSVRRRWDLWLFGMSVAILLPTLLSYALLASPDPLAGTARELAAGVEASLVRPVSPPPPEVPASRGIEAAFASPGDVRAGEEWTYHRVPAITVKVVEIVAPPPPPSVRFQPPLVVSAEAVPGRVALAWREAERNNVRATGYHVYRRTGEPGAYERVTREPVRGTLFEDGTAAPARRYEYAVAAVTDDARVAGGEGKSSEPRGVDVPDAIRLELTGGLLLPDRGEAVATVRVRRFHEGRWWEKDYAVKAGDAVGRPERMRHEGRTVEVDFTTGRTVRSVEPVEARGPGGAKTVWKATLERSGAVEVLTTR
jgi:hypothetical protein